MTRLILMVMLITNIEVVEADALKYSMLDKNTNCKMFVDSKLDDWTFIWHGDCVDGLLQGYNLYDLYNHDGKLVTTEVKFIKGKAEGDFVTTSKDSITVGTMVDGRIEGLAITKTNTGVKTEATYVHGKMNGLLITYQNGVFISCTIVDSNNPSNSRPCP